MPIELFHYTKAQTALEHILVEKTLKISQFQFTNDPKESKGLEFFKFTGPAPTPLQADSYPAVRKKIRETAIEIKLKEWKVLCFTQNHDDLETGKVSNNPFLAGKYRPAMWAHYASSPGRSRDGVCLKFSYEKLKRRISETFSDKEKYFFDEGIVEYSDLKLIDQPPFSMDNIFKLDDSEIEQRAREYFLENCKHIFLIKANDWSNETEYRWFVHSRNYISEKISIDGILDEVLIGDNFPKVYGPSLSALCSSLNVSAKRICWFNGHPDERLIYPP